MKKGINLKIRKRCHSQIDPSRGLKKKMKLQRRVVNCGKIGHSAPAKHGQEIGHVKRSVTKAKTLWAHDTL